jgi:hypothetical protein
MNFANLSPFSHAVPSSGSKSPNQVSAASRNSSADEEPPRAALSVKGPAKDQFRTTIVFSGHPSEPMVNERRLPDPSPCNDRNYIYIPVCPCIIEESDILLSTKNITSCNR